METKTEKLIYCPHCDTVHAGALGYLGLAGYTVMWFIMGYLTAQVIVINDGILFFVFIIAVSSYVIFSIYVFYIRFNINKMKKVIAESIRKDLEEYK